MVEMRVGAVAQNIVINMKRVGCLKSLCITILSSSVLNYCHH